MVNFQPAGITQEVYSPDRLLVMGPFETRSITLARSIGQTTALARGRVLAGGADGKYHALAAAATAVALNDVLFVDDFGAGAALQYDFTLAKPPIPGTLRVVTVDQGTTTVVLDCGTDNGQGVGSGAGGTFTVDYHTGRVHVFFATAPSDDDDGTFSYQHLAPAAGVLGLPTAILAEDIAAAAVDAADVVSLGYVRGTFNSQALVGYHAGFEPHLNLLGIHIKTNAH